MRAFFRAAGGTPLQPPGKKPALRDHGLRRTEASAPCGAPFLCLIEQEIVQHPGDFSGIQDQIFLAEIQFFQQSDAAL